MLILSLHFLLLINDNMWLDLYFFSILFWEKVLGLYKLLEGKIMAEEIYEKFSLKIILN